MPRLGADPSTARYELLTAAQAVERVAAVGFDRADAARMVDQYLDRNTAAMGLPPGDGWRIDPFDLAEIARAYDWVDHYQGETITDARARAAGYATDFQHRADAVDRIEDPGYAARLDREAQLWAARAGEEYTPWPSLQSDVVRGLVPPRTGHPPARSDSGHDIDGQGDDDGGVRGPADPGPPSPLPSDGTGARHGDPASRDDWAGGPGAAGESQDGDRAHDGPGVGEAPAAVAWWEPVDPEFTLTREEVVSELTHRGMSTDQAAAAVTRYLEETSREIGVPVHQWGMDSHDLDAITHTHAAVLTGRPESDPWAQAAGPDLTAAAQVGPDREDGGPVSDGRGPDLPSGAPDLAVHRPDLDAIAAERRVAAARDAVAQAAAPARNPRQAEGDAEQDRRLQLAAWAHDNDTSTDGAEHGMELQR